MSQKRKARPAYPVEFRQQIVELVASGHCAAELSREFGVSAQSIGEWAKKAGALEAMPRAASLVAASRHAVGVTQKLALSSDERAELERLRKDNKRLQLERNFLAKATAWFAGTKTRGFNHAASSRLFVLASFNAYVFSHILMVSALTFAPAKVTLGGYDAQRDGSAPGIKPRGQMALLSAMWPLPLVVDK